MEIPGGLQQQLTKQFNKTCKFYIAYFSLFGGLNTAQVNWYCITRVFHKIFIKAFFS